MSNIVFVPCNLKLKPCSRCGGKAKLWHYEGNLVSDGFCPNKHTKISCEKCFFSIDWVISTSYKDSSETDKKAAS